MYVTNYMPASCFIICWKRTLHKGLEEIEVTGTHSAMQICEWLWHMAGWLFTTFPTVPNLHSVMSISLTPLRNTLLASSLQQMMTAGCCFSGYNIWHWFILCQDVRLGAILGEMFKFLWKYDVQQLLLMCHIYIDVRVKTSASDWLLSYLKLFCTFCNCESYSYGSQSVVQSV